MTRTPGATRIDDTTVRPDSAQDDRRRERPATPATAALLARYRGYRLRQGRDLLNLVPRDGLRDIVRACRPLTASAGADASLDDLAAFCADLLPLPPLSVWMADFQSNRAAHLVDEAPAEAGPRSPDGTPVAVAVRHFSHQGDAWVAQLQVWPLHERWEGAIEFHTGDGGSTFRTGPVFQEAGVASVRDRFRSFDDPTLCAFLRSSLP